MRPAVRLTDGIEIELASGETVVCDGRAAGDRTVLSHAHGDHAVSPGSSVVCSALTAALFRERRGGNVSIDEPDGIELVDAGHVAGSRAAVIDDPERDRTYCYTGDVCTRDRFYLEGFDPPDADVLVLEATYGTPQYRLPPTAEVTAEVHDWLADTMDRVVVLYGYSLGRAQKLLAILGDSPRDRVLVAESVADVTAVIEGHLDVAFEYDRYADADSVERGDAIVLPPGANTGADVASLVASGDAVTAGFSGWAVDESFRYRRGYDEAFALSDHCDFDELLAVVRRVDPDRVYTHHGFADAFARHVTAELGYEARSLKRNQSTLSEF